MDPRRWSRSGAVLLVSVSLALAHGGGCGVGGTADGQDAPTVEQARGLVHSALEAWKGGTASGLERREPPVRFVDPDLARGATLVDYTILEGQERPVGPVVDLAVDLRIRDRKGKSQSIHAFYQVATRPGLAVLRNDPD